MLKGYNFPDKYNMLMAQVFHIYDIPMTPTHNVDIYILMPIKYFSFKFPFNLVCYNILFISEVEKKSYNFLKKATD